jgi:hypothetical protein
VAYKVAEVAFEELEGTIKAIENGEKINDWGSISAGMLCCARCFFQLSKVSSFRIRKPPSRAAYKTLSLAP